MNFLKRKIKPIVKNKKQLLFLLGLIVIGLFFVFLPDGIAQIQTNEDKWLEVSNGTAWDHMVALIGNILILIITLVGHLLLFFMKIVVGLFQYNNFIHAYAVEIGWPLMRDLMNITFIIILLIVSFSTILKISRYHYKGILWKLLIMAILVNFSKTILGFIIDISQVIMMTFVNGFKGAMEVNLANSFGVGNLLQFDEAAVGQGSLDKSSLIMGLILALALVVTACFTMVVYTVVLLWRIISLWISVILSPLAFVGQAFPGLKKHSADFWSKFWNVITVGVAMSFFMWLSLTILAMSDGVPGQFGVEEDVPPPPANGEDAEVKAIAITKASNPENLFTYVVAIVLLLMGLQYAQQAGGFAGKFAGSALSGLGKLGKKAAGAPFKVGGFVAKEGIDKLHEKTGVDLNVNRNIERFKHARAEKKRKQLHKGDTAARETVRSGNWATSRMAASTGGLKDHYEEYGAWRGTAKMAGIGLKNPHFQLPLLNKSKGWRKFMPTKESPFEKHSMGKAAQDKSDSLLDDANDEKSEGQNKEQLIANGGGNGVYLNTANEQIDKDRKRLDVERDELEQKFKTGKITEDEQMKEDGKIEEKIKELDKEQAIVQGRLTIEGVNFETASNSEINEFVSGINQGLSADQERVAEHKEKEAKLQVQIDKAKKDGKHEDFDKLTTRKALEVQERENAEADVKRNESALKVLDLDAENFNEDGYLKKATLSHTVNKVRESAAKTTDLEGYAKTRRDNRLARITDTEPKEAEKRRTELEELEKLSELDPTKREENRERIHELRAEVKEDESKTGELTKVNSRLKELDKKEELTEEEKVEKFDLRKDKKALESEVGYLNLQGEKGNETLTPEKIIEYKAQAEEHRKKENEARIRAVHAAPVVGFEAQRAQRSMEAEEMDKIKDINNEQELITIFRAAQADGDKARMAAVFRKLAMDYNDNEITNAYGYSSGYNGFLKFVQNEIQGGKGKNGCFSEQEALALANDVSFINESRNHYNTSRVATMQNGKWRWYSQEEHCIVAGTETSKRSERDIANKFNRLCYGGEDAMGNFIMEPLGGTILRQHTNNWLENERLILEHLNSSAAQKMIEAERKTGAISKALVGMKSVRGQDLSRELIRLLHKKVGSSPSGMETIADTAKMMASGRYGV